MSEDKKITTHSLGGGWFYSAINGQPLVGINGAYSRFKSRKRAKDAAKERSTNSTT